MLGSTFFGLDISQLSTRLLAIRRRISKRVLVLEFRHDCLLLAEATLTQTGVQLNHISSFTLPPEALDRGVPAEPLKMASLVNDFCAEKKIPAHRAAVVLPPYLAFHRRLDLPESLTTDEARDYVLNPANGLQIPFPLTQTDFDLFPILTPTEQQNVGNKCLYMLTAIPEVLVDPIIEMLQAADLELQLLELGSHSLLRNYAADLITLAPQQVDLVLELLPDCSNLMLVSCSGLLGSERLSSIRNLPELDLDSDQMLVAFESGVSAEDLVFKDESYLPLSELDLRVLVSDLRASFERFHLKLPGAEIRRVVLTGVNSSHPLLPDLLTEMLGLPVVLSQFNSVTGVAGLSMGSLLLQSGLGRLIGLALGLLPNDQLLACSLEDHSLNDQESQPKNDALAIAELLSTLEEQRSLDLMAVEGDSSTFLSEQIGDDDLSVSVDLKVEDPVSLEHRSSLNDAIIVEASDQSDDLLAIPVDPSECSEFSTDLPSEGSFEQEPIATDLRPIEADIVSEEELPPIDLPDAQNLLDLESEEVEECSDEQWSAINGFSDDIEAFESISARIDSSEDVPQDEITSSREGISSEDEDASLPESEWPSIASQEPIGQSLGAVSRVIEDTSAWPSISSEEDFLGLAGDCAAVEDFSSNDGGVQQKIDASQVEDLDTQNEDLSISNLKKNAEVIGNQKKSTSNDRQFIGVDARSSFEETQELGELRFADED